MAAKFTDDIGCLRLVFDSLKGEALIRTFSKRTISEADRVLRLDHESWQRDTPLMVPVSQMLLSRRLERGSILETVFRQPIWTG